MDDMQTQAHTNDMAPRRPAPPGWGESFRMPLFRPGTRVQRAGQWETVEYVKLRRQELMVYLAGHPEPVHSRELHVEPTVFTTVRVCGSSDPDYGADV